MHGEEVTATVDVPSPSLETVVDAIGDVFYVVAPGERLVRWNDRLPAVTGYDDAELADMRTPELLPRPERDRLPAHAAEVRECGDAAFESRLVTKDGHRVPFEFRDRLLTDGDGEPAGRCGLGRTVRGPQRREAALRREMALTETVFDAVPELLYAFDESGRFLRWNDRVPAVTGYDDAEIAGMEPLEFVAPDDRERVARAIESVIEDGTVETVAADLLTRDGERIPHEVTGARIEDARGGLHGLVGAGRDVSGRKRRERDLARQRDELRRLHHVNGLIRDVNRALVEADDRGTVQRALCEHLTAGAEGYAFAWVGEPDLGAGRLEPREAAGEGDGYLDDVTVEFRGDDPGGPAARAVRSGTAQVARAIERPAESRWAEAAAARGFGSGLAVPIGYDGTRYAVLNVYADRPDAFDDRERTVLTELAETVGHALNAILRRDVLAGDETVELEFRIDGGASPLTDLALERTGRLRVDRMVRVGEDRTLWYVTADGDDPDRVRALADLDVVDEVSLLSAGEDRHRFEVVAGEPPLTGALAGHGGRVRRMDVEEGELSVLAELPPGADLRAVKRSVRDAMPAADLVAQRPATRQPESLPEVRECVTGTLTDRQRTVLEAAFAAGYFERPRRTTGEELAASLDVTRSTLHQHLRVATRKLVAAVLDGESGPY